MYWRFDEGIQHVELDYPRDLDMWKGVPENFDAVFQVSDLQMGVRSQHSSISPAAWELFLS